METPVLFQFTYSHFNEKARWALDFKRVPHVRHSLLPGEHIRKILAMTGQTSVPVLMIDGKPVFDSTRIIETLEHLHPHPTLYPADPEMRRRALELEDFFDERLGPYDRLWLFHLALPYPDYLSSAFACRADSSASEKFRAGFPALSAAMISRMNINAETAEFARGKTLAAMDRLEKELQPSGYLVGESFSVADLTAAALLSPLFNPPEFPYRSSEPVPAPVAGLLEPLKTRPAYRWVMDMYRRHRGQSAEVTAS